MKTSRILLVAVILISLVCNVLLFSQKLERDYYIKGAVAGKNQIVRKVIEDITTNGQVEVNMPDGTIVTLVPKVPLVGDK